MQRSTALICALAAALLLTGGPALAVKKRCPFACFGTKKADVLIGTDGDNDMYAKAGNDTLKAKGGNDTLEGDKGNDKLFAGDGDDSLYGDKIFDADAAGNDQMDGGEGADSYVFLKVAWGTDTIIDTEVTAPGFGQDNGIFLYSDALHPDAAITINLASDSGPAPEVSNTTGSTIQWNGNVIDQVIVDTNADDTVTGNDAPNQIDLNGGAGSDTANGAGGDDDIRVNDGQGDDTVDCGDGTDTVLSDAGDTVAANCEIVNP